MDWSVIGAAVAAAVTGILGWQAAQPKKKRDEERDVVEDRREDRAVEFTEATYKKLITQLEEEIDRLNKELSAERLSRANLQVAYLLSEDDKHKLIRKYAGREARESDLGAGLK